MLVGGAGVCTVALTSLSLRLSDRLNAVSGGLDLGIEMCLLVMQN